jgi:holliday junction DNA helicase RuvA
MRMITRLRGTVIEIDSQKLTIDVQSVGYEVTAVDGRLYTLNQEVDIAIYYHWVDEQGPSLFGFESSLARAVFSQILSCTGCGPKIGLAVLGFFTPQAFLQAISCADVKGLSRVSGIGTKKAELMIMQLKDKVTKIVPAHVAPEHTTLIKIRQLQGALTSLHYKQSEITSALDHLTTQTDMNAIPFDELLRKALAHLSKHL